ncbi:hypothetical protein LMH87_004898 [Akanthomyces muscarius]|uniref:Uncharacterized protein n=1 Tax=Akanthomyces muscarius TaxID=2231603 RepID=A0A9W8UI39_AKAMU|nr:hypothetical protein LMH87_004898 [Akanthomyces muscarius]KAJ4146068.1 hypothetical protein LMH87_004898 [Akanthomyces muscarius]
MNSTLKKISQVNDEGVMDISPGLKSAMHNYLATADEKEFHTNGWVVGNTKKAHGEGNRGTFGIVCSLQQEPTNHVTWLVHKQEQIKGTQFKWGPKEPEACDVMRHYKLNFGDKSTVKNTNEEKNKEKQELIAELPTKLAVKLTPGQQAKLERSKKHLNVSEKYYNGEAVEGSEGYMEKSE